MEEIMVKRLFTLTLISTIFCWGGLAYTQEIVSKEVDEQQLAGFFALVAQPNKIIDQIARAVDTQQDISSEQFDALHQAIEYVKHYCNENTEQTPNFSRLLEDLENAVLNFEQVCNVQPVIENLSSTTSHQQELLENLLIRNSKDIQALALEIQKNITSLNLAIENYQSTSNIQATLKSLQPIALKLSKTFAVRGLTNDAEQTVEGKALAIDPSGHFEFFEAGIQFFSDVRKKGEYSFEGIRHSTLLLLFGGSISNYGINKTGLTKLSHIDRLKVLQEADSLLPNSSFLSRLLSACTEGMTKNECGFLHSIINYGWLDNKSVEQPENKELILWLFDEYKNYLNKIDDNLLTIADHTAQNKANLSKILDLLLGKGAKLTYHIGPYSSFDRIIDMLQENFETVKNKFIIIKMEWKNINSLSGMEIERLAQFNIAYLNIGNNNLTDLPEELTSLKNLQYLNINGNNLTPNALKVIGQISSLETLCLDHCSITDLPEELTNLKNLKYLKINGNNLTPNALSVVQQLRQQGIRVYPFFQGIY